MKKTVNCMVAQSGGPTAAINASLLGVIKGALASEDIGKIYGAVNGIEGVINEKFILLEQRFEDEENQKLLKQTPASFLGSCRLRLPSEQKDLGLYESIFKVFEKLSIGFFFYIGGNDSMDTVLKLSNYAQKIGSFVKVMGIPKTIDNDLPCTDHTPGFGSAAKYIATTIAEIGRDVAVYNLKSATIVEVMGRNAGWLTASSVLSRNEMENAPHLIYLPEHPFDDDLFIHQVSEKIETFGNVVVAVSEGVKYKNGTYVCESASSGLCDAFGHKYLSGTNKVLENMVRHKLGIKARGVELNISQRCAAHFPSKVDLDESESIGFAAVELAIQGETGKMMTFERVSDLPYKIKIGSIDIIKAANMEKVIPQEWITDKGSNVSQKMEEYLRPLVQGELDIITQNGLPKYVVR